MFPFPRLGAVCFALALLALPALAQNTPDEEPEVTVVVTADRIEGPQSESIATATVITAGEMQREGAQTAADALKLAPGVEIKQNGQLGALAAASIRGATPNQVLVLVDGMRISNSSFMVSADLSKFPVEEIDRIEIIRGPVSSLYGSDAIGGVINIITKHPEGSGGSSILGFGNHGRQTRMLAVHGAVPQVGWQLDCSLPAFDGTRPNSDFGATDLTGRLGFPDVRGWKTRLRVEHYRDGLGTPGADLANTGFADPDDRQNWDRDEYDLSASRALAGGNLTWRTYYTRQKLNNFYTFTGDPNAYTTLVTGDTRVAEATYARTLGAHGLLTGVEFRREGYKDDELTNGASSSNQNKRITNQALYAQDRWGVTPLTDLVLGLRYDDHSIAGSRLAPRAGVNVAVRPDMNLRASYSEGFRSPALVELYYNAMGMSGNSNLKAETSDQYEVGMNWQGKRDSLDVAVFHNLVYNEIQWAGITFNNVARTRHQGLEVSWERKLTAAMRLSASYSYLDAIDRDSGQRLLRLPRHQGTVSLSTSRGSWGGALTARWGASRPDILGFNPNPPFNSIVGTLPSRTVFDLSVSRGAGAVQPYLTLRNIFNTSYQEVAGYRAESRGVEVGVRSMW